MSSQRILYVEDEEDIRECVATLLAAEGYDVCTAPTAEEGLDALRHGRFDALLTDWRLPAHDGGWLLSRVAEEKLLPPERAVVLSADRAEVPQGHVLLRKPVDVDVLVATLSRALRAAPKDAVPVSVRGEAAIEITLYVTGGTLRSQKAIRRLARVLEGVDPGRVSVKVYDVADGSPETALALEVDRVVVTPTLIRKRPGPVIAMVGDECLTGVEDLLAQVGLDDTRARRPPRVVSPSTQVD